MESIKVAEMQHDHVHMPQQWDAYKKEILGRGFYGKLIILNLY